ncbi:MAG: glycosyltransferase family 4 protein [Chroococcidiopsidaceae cyanobacterium CP_BM_RX_35]|nr:glycosyltransferase family 4 protein [Chroococcidiopsidaceae cyanobacterium CP_BM_RX_35]
MYIYFIRTYYPHWGKHSGIHQFVKYLNSQIYESETWLASDSDEGFPIKNNVIRAYLRHKVQEQGMQWYKLSDLVAEFKAVQKAWSYKVDIIHYLDGEHSAQFLPKLFTLSHTRQPKLVATYHQPPELLDTLINKRIIPQLDFIVVVSPEQVSYFAEYIEPHKICLILHGIDTDYFKPHRYRRESKSFKCITVGKYLRDFDALRKVAEMLSSEKYIEFHLVSSNASNQQKLPNIKVYQGISDTDLLALYQQSDILFLPLTQSTANNALLEGIACGLPVISTDLPSVRTYLPSKEAILIQDNRPEKVVEAILYLKNHPSEREIMGISARKRAEELSWRNISPSYEKIYSQLCSFV